MDLEILEQVIRIEETNELNLPTLFETDSNFDGEDVYTGDISDTETEYGDY